MLILMIIIWFLTYISARKLDSKETYDNNSLFLVKNASLRVIGGHKVRKNRYTYVVLLTRRRGDELKRICTACMLAEQWVLTAAHCCTGNANIAFSNLYIWYGNFTISASTTNLYSHVLNTFVHPSYRLIRRPYFKNVNDIGLLRVDKINMPSYGRLLAVDHTSLIGLPVTFLGGGRTNLTMPVNGLAPLHAGEGVIIACDVDFASNRVICISPKCSNKMNSPNKGDSGSPLIHDGYVIGVCSYGRTRKKYVNNAYTPISPYIDWIHNVMQSEE